MTGNAQMPPHDDTHAEDASRPSAPPLVTEDVQLQEAKEKRRVGWKNILGRRGADNNQASNNSGDLPDDVNQRQSKPKWSMGMLNDPETDEVPGSILLLSKVSEFNEPLGLRNAPARNSVSSIHSPYPPPSRSGSIGSHRRRAPVPEKKLTKDGRIILEPQPDETPNDPLNWAVWRRDLALLSLGIYCMIGGGVTPILAAGFEDVAETYDVTVPQVALTVGLYMLGQGIGCVLLSPTAILYGKRPVYLASAVVFILSSVWCALSPTYASLLIARIVQGMAVSSVEALPSATIAEIFFLHEKAYRLGIYTLLLLGGKNLVPLVSAAIVQSLGWRWVFWILAMVVGFAGCLLFVFVPETFWDRAPRPHKSHRHGRRLSKSTFNLFHPTSAKEGTPRTPKPGEEGEKAGTDQIKTIAERRAQRHAHFGPENDTDEENEKASTLAMDSEPHRKVSTPEPNLPTTTDEAVPAEPASSQPLADSQTDNARAAVHDYFANATQKPSHTGSATPVSRTNSLEAGAHTPLATPNPYTSHYTTAPPKTFLEQLRPFSGRLCKVSWHRVCLRPFILFAYPSILWSGLVYSLSVGWLIVLSESVAHIYQDPDSYNFTPLQTGLVYISPFIGGVLGTAVAGKLSDLIVRWMSRRNGGVYEPEFRLVMAIPVALFTTIGLMAFGWSAEAHDNWIVPTVFFGFISFGCSLGSTTAITFAVDSYRQYAGEALVTLNFSKNVLHGLVFSLFFNHWLESEGSRDTFVAIGGIHIALLLTTVPMYVYGKRARMWTVRRNLMEKF
ncbi:hypothetical protein MBLNU230_g6845t1 [Neophaeotheca triangularis]